jgi:predicted nuclease of predicted toxin-antitoxin system
LRLLFDQNISPRIIKQVEEQFPLAKQVRHLGLEDASDIGIFEFAKSHDTRL